MLINNIPSAVKEIIKILYEAEHKAYLVGGCVRDSIMGRECSDWDISTSAKPEEVVKLFNDKCFNVIETGLKHGTVTVGHHGSDKIDYCEITTFRVDGEYKDNRRPESVTFSKKLADDLSRRDFTVNAICYNPDTGIIDHFNSLEDLEKKILRTGIIRKNLRLSSSSQRHSMCSQRI